MTTKAQNLGIRRERYGYVFQWGPNEYAVKRNFNGTIVWKRCTGCSYWWKRVDLTSFKDSVFCERMMACVEQLMLEN